MSPCLETKIWQFNLDNKLIFKNPLSYLSCPMFLSWIYDNYMWLAFPCKYEARIVGCSNNTFTEKRIMERFNYFSVSLGKNLGNHLNVFMRVFGLYLSSAGVRERFHYGGSVGLCLNVHLDHRCRPIDIEVMLEYHQSSEQWLRWVAWTGFVLRK